MVHPGSGGGGGATDDHSNTSGSGGRGGGIIMLFVDQLLLEGRLEANGTTGTRGADVDDSGNGGGGSGGSIWLRVGVLSGQEASAGEEGVFVIRQLVVTSEGPHAGQEPVATDRSRGRHDSYPITRLQTGWANELHGHIL